MSSPERSATTTESADPGAGLLELELALDHAGRTVLVKHRQRFPLRVTVPLYADPADPGTPLVLVQNPTGGLFPGDRLETVLRAGEGTRLRLGTPSATKVYAACAERTTASSEAVQRTRVYAAAGAYVELVPQPIIPHAGARGVSHTEISLAPGAVVLACEQLAAGRVASGESFAYRRMELAVTVRDSGGHELVADTMAFEPARQRPDGRGLQGGLPYVATLLLAGLDLDGARLAAALDAVAASAVGVVAAAGELPNGAGVAARLLGPSAPSIGRALDALRARVRCELLGLGLPPRRIG